jgi:DNA-directed RNA polymerase beta subunit
MRYGNKSVIAKICKDEDMPYTKDGRRVDLLLNMLAVIR